MSKQYQLFGFCLLLLTSHHFFDKTIVFISFTLLLHEFSNRSTILTCVWLCVIFIKTTVTLTVRPLSNSAPSLTNGVMLVINIKKLLRVRVALS